MEVLVVDARVEAFGSLLQQARMGAAGERGLERRSRVTAERVLDKVQQLELLAPS